MKQIILEFAQDLETKGPTGIKARLKDKTKNVTKKLRALAQQFENLNPDQDQNKQKFLYNQFIELTYKFAGYLDKNKSQRTNKIVQDFFIKLENTLSHSKKAEESLEVKAERKLKM